MKLSELLAMPVGIKIEEYERLLQDKKKLEKQLRNICDTIDTENYSLEILSDELGSERYNKHLFNKQKNEVKKEKIQEKIKLIEMKLR